jgi:hypothetical protein
VGTDTGTPVGLYPNNFSFTGKIKKVTIDLKPAPKADRAAAGQGTIAQPPQKTR